MVANSEQSPAGAAEDSLHTCFRLLDAQSTGVLQGLEVAQSFLSQLARVRVPRVRRKLDKFETDVTSVPLQACTASLRKRFSGQGKLNNPAIIG